MSCEIVSHSSRSVEMRNDAFPVQQNERVSHPLGIAMSESTLSQTADTTGAKKNWYASITGCLLKIFHACTCNLFKQKEKGPNIAVLETRCFQARERLHTAEAILENYLNAHPDLRPLVTAYRQARDAARELPPSLRSAMVALHANEEAIRLHYAIRTAETATYDAQRAVAIAQANPTRVTTPGEVPPNIAQAQQTLQMRRNELAIAERNLAANAGAARFHEAVHLHPLRRAERNAERDILEHPELAPLYREVTRAEGYLAIANADRFRAGLNLRPAN